MDEKKNIEHLNRILKLPLEKNLIEEKKTKCQSQTIALGNNVSSCRTKKFHKERMKSLVKKPCTREKRSYYECDSTSPPLTTRVG
jgi:hypothetical protein